MAETGYREIADHYRAAIRRGDYGPGDNLPRQQEIARDYGVNVGTVRRAISALRDEGLVDPIQRRGTVVRKRELIQLPANRYLRATPTMGPWETACADQGLVGVTEVDGVSYQRADPRIAGELNIAVGDLVVHRVNRMLVGRQTRQLQDTWIPMWVAGGTDLAMAAKVVGGINHGLTVAQHPPAHSVERVESRMPIPAERRALGLGRGSPVLDARRVTTQADGRVILFVQLVAAGDHVCFVYFQDL